MVSVQLELDNKKRIIPIDSDTILLKREFETATGKDSYKFNNQVILKNDVYSLFGLNGITFNEMWRTIHQGKINEIANLDERGILELLFDYSGATHLKERLDKLKDCLALCDDKKKSIDKFKETVEEKLDYIASKVSDFEKLQKLSAEKNSYEYLKLKKTGETLQNDLDANDEKRKDLILKLNDVKVKKTNFLQKHELMVMKIREFESSLAALKDKRRICKEFIELNAYSSSKEQADMQSIKAFQDALERNYEDMGKTPKELKKALAETLSEKAKLLELIDKWAEEHKDVQTQYFDRKEEYDTLNEELNSISLKRTGFSSDKERKKYYKDEIDRVVTEITTLERDRDIEVKNKSKNEEMKESIASGITQIKNELEDKRKEEQKICNELDPSKKRHDNLSQIQKMNFGLNEK